VAAHASQIQGAARILGVHLEGPYISPHFPGAQPAEHIRPPNLDEFAELMAAGPLRMITLAPEVAGAEALIRRARRQGVTVVLGHTNASYEECATALEWGVSQATHTYNAMSGLHHRRPGALGAVLSLDTIDAQLIADNIHIHPAGIKILARCKGIDRTILITDAIRAAGLGPGEYEFAGQVVTVKGDECRLPDGTLAGSILTMDRALVNFMSASGLSLAEAWPVASRTPARAIGLAREIGTLAPGYRGDLVLLDERLTVVATVVGGEVVFLREGELGRLLDIQQS
jgi:N-acetylglucosamine-6-phosphate deacetylase